MATAKSDATDGASSQDLADSATKTADQQAAQDKTAKDPSSPAPQPLLNHGEPDPFVLAEAEARKEAAKDPFGDRPLQMRDTQDPLVDPQTDDQLPAPGVKSSGLEPARTNQLNPDLAVQGTLPPV